MKAKILLLIMLSANIVFGQIKPKVAVYIAGKQDAGVNKVLGDQLVAAIVNSGAYIAIERTNNFLAELGKEQNYQRTGAVSDDEISRLGKQFGVQFVCIAEISEVFGEKYIAARLIDVESAQVTKTANATNKLTSMDDLKEVTNELTTNLFQTTGKMPDVIYAAHVQDIGWMEERRNGNQSGTTGRGKRLEAFHIRLDCPTNTGGIKYCAHVQGLGWQLFASDGETAGTLGQKRRIEAIKIELTGKVSSKFDVYYRAHVEKTGWTRWVKNGTPAGITGKSLRIEAMEVRLEMK